MVEPLGLVANPNPLSFAPELNILAMIEGLGVNFATIEGLKTCLRSNLRIRNIELLYEELIETSTGHQNCHMFRFIYCMAGSTVASDFKILFSYWRTFCELKPTIRPEQYFPFSRDVISGGTIIVAYLSAS